ncbi:hypothetical protein B0H15DRAFT_1022486 [Mycena belliarum]|uniref:Uncharacterized protein n=1 Tax=Mycena belliarum TaxID=1033014 RepID=A0AAD6U4R7_9AGAR|nr:hypothetical protein B0H15DRAFT_1022486 [Mycena belliae]
MHTASPLRSKAAALPYVRCDYYETNSSLCARLVQTHIASNIAASPRCRRLPRIERARRSAFVMRPPREPRAARAVPPVNPRVGLRARLQVRIVSWYELGARGRRSPHAEPSSPLPAAPSVACESVRPPCRFAQVHGCAPWPLCRATSAGPSPNILSFDARPPHVALAASRQDFPRNFRSCGQRWSCGKLSGTTPDTCGRESPPQAAHAQHAANARYLCACCTRRVKHG